jgi:hypothetical protein
MEAIKAQNWAVEPQKKKTHSLPHTSSWRSAFTGTALPFAVTQCVVGYAAYPTPKLLSGSGVP